MDKSPPGQRDDAVSPLSILQVELCGPTQPSILLLPSRCQPSFLAIARVSEVGTQEERPGGTPSLIRTERHSLVTVQLASGSEADNMWLKEPGQVGVSGNLLLMCSWGQLIKALCACSDASVVSDILFRVTEPWAAGGPPLRPASQALNGTCPKRGQAGDGRNLDPRIGCPTNLKTKKKIHCIFLKSSLSQQFDYNALGFEDLKSQGPIPLYVSKINYRPQ